MIGRGMWK